MAIPWWQLATVGGSALAGYLGNKNASAETPKAYQPLEQLLINNAMQRMRDWNTLKPSLEAQGISQTNRMYGNAGQSLSNTLTARGLSRSPVAGAAEAKLETGRASDISRFQQQLPLAIREAQGQDLGQAANLVLGSRVTPGNPAGGAASSGASMLAYLMGSGAFGGGGGTAGAGAGSALAPEAAGDFGTGALLQPAGSSGHWYDWLLKLFGGGGGAPSGTLTPEEEQRWRLLQQWMNENPNERTEW